MIKRISKPLAALMLMVILTSVASMGFAVDVSPSVESAEWLLELSMDEWVAVAVEPYVDVNTLEYGYERDNESSITTDHARYVLGDRALGIESASSLGLIKSAQQESGKFADHTNGEGSALVNAHIWGILGLYISYDDDYNKASALEWLKSAQNEDGSFSVYVEEGASSIEGSPDLTAMAVCALAAAGMENNGPEIAKAMTYLENWIGEAESTRGGASAETISWWIMAKQFIGRAVEQQDMDLLEAYRLEDGSYKHLKNGKRGNRMATYHALLAISGYEKESSWMKDLRFKEGIRTSSGAYLTIERIVGLAKSGVLKADNEGLYTWEEIREAIKLY